jgi:hypothetical protein
VRIREISGKGLCLFSVPLMRAGLGAFGPIGPADPGLLTHIKGQRHAVRRASFMSRANN